MIAKYFYNPLLFYVLTTLGVYAQNKPEKCGTMANETYLLSKNPRRATPKEFEQQMAHLLEKKISNKSENNGVITIPIVVHVVHNGQKNGVGANITDEQVASQITVLNNDFRRKIGTPGENSHPAGADTRIEFALAQVDPNGNPINGINRVYFDHKKWDQKEIQEILKPQTIWNPDQYLNLWTVDFTSEELLGYAQFPSLSAIPDLPLYDETALTDGTVASYGTFGSREIYPKGNYSGYRFDKGRTMTHEIGHWLGVRHIWGDAYCGNDYCNDTPVAHIDNKGCPIINSCTGLEKEMVENYMDYTDDICMNIFTQDQANRMITVLNNALRRKELKTSTKEKGIPLLTNDAEIIIEREFTTFSNSCNISPRKYSLVNRGTNVINSIKISYSFNGQSAKNIDWQGSLQPNEWALFEVPESGNVNDELEMSIVDVNGSADSRISNNLSKTKITNTSDPEIFNYEEVNLELQLDNKGSEISWTFTDKDGNILNSGGPYEDDNPQFIQEKFEIKNNSCYVFKITDTRGDGLCCNQGEGHYSLGYNSENIIIREGNFGSSSTKGFIIQQLSDEIYLVENPVNNELLFHYGGALGNISDGSIYDITGKLVKKFEAKKTELNTVDISLLSKGLYFLNLNSEYNTKTVKFIKN
ncbi:M43 family zinc metalloprotease [Flavobacterium sp.]|uniref:M43 family zinc metalloprotease n=1 Tax=Flavobacterium sp. TaxID=239 RepID=UPI003D0E42A8